MARESLQREFAHLIALHQKLLHSLCSLYYPLPEDRQDLFQEIVLQLWKAYPAFKHQSKVSTWMYRVAMNTVFARIRKEKKRPKSESFSEQTFQVAESESELTQDTQELYQAISRLSDVDKAIITLYLDEHTYEEMAHILEMSRTNISTKINRIKIRLGKLLKKEWQ